MTQILSPKEFEAIANSGIMVVAVMTQPTSGWAYLADLIFYDLMRQLNYKFFYVRLNTTFQPELTTFFPAQQDLTISIILKGVSLATLQELRSKQEFKELLLNHL